MASKISGGVQPLFERNQEATCYVGNLDNQVNEEILWELMVQCGPVVNVHIPRDKITQTHSGYGFAEFRSEEDAEYAMKIMNMVKLFGKPIRVNKASQDKRTLEVGANLFVGNLDPEVDEKLLFDTFKAFGTVLSTKVMRDPETGVPKGFGFVAFDSFESSDLALETMNGQYLASRPIHVSYAYKKDTKGERHGSEAERLLANSKPVQRPFMMGVPPPMGLPPSYPAAPPPVGTPMPMQGFAAPPPPQYYPGMPMPPMMGMPTMPPQY